MGNKGPLKVLNGTKLILDDQKNKLDSFRITLESFRFFTRPLIIKPVTGQELFFAVSYSKPALTAYPLLHENKKKETNTEAGNLITVTYYYDFRRFYDCSNK